MAVIAWKNSHACIQFIFISIYVHMYLHLHSDRCFTKHFHFDKDAGKVGMKSIKVQLKKGVVFVLPGYDGAQVFFSIPWELLSLEV